MAMEPVPATAGANEYAANAETFFAAPRVSVGLFQNEYGKIHRDGQETAGCLSGGRLTARCACREGVLCAKMRRR